ncbi:MAG TPA: DUF4440 domain-containing protein [Usitatibacter sp.]|nr:DUF4440 domain-containing protein [Usitatibacter sp.]
MKIHWLAAALALGACAPHPPMHAPDLFAGDVPASLAAAETAFAAHSMREDMRSAFLAAFDDDGVFVRGGWLVSHEFLRPRPAPAIILDWRPQYVEVARSGDLGLSTGPSKIVSRAQPDAPPAYGQFVSVWRRDASGAWKVAVDLGISHPAADLWSEPLQARVSPTSVAAAAGSLQEAEARFADEARERGARAAYEAQAATDMRYYRGGKAPVHGRSSAIASAASDERHVWTVERSETARSGDFGYVRGKYASTAQDAPLGWYLRVWRREAGGWRIVMDVTNAATPS